MLLMLFSPNLNIAGSANRLPNQSFLNKLAIRFFRPIFYGQEMVLLGTHNATTETIILYHMKVIIATYFCIDIYH